MRTFFGVIGFLSLFVLSGCTTAGNSPTTNEPSAKVLAEEGYVVIGDAGAPITFYEFSDYQCPFCKKFTTETLPIIKEEYVDTGKVKFVFKDFPLEIHEGARVGAVAARCAGEQGKYFEYHDVLFDNSKDISDDNLKLWAENIGLNANEFSNCLDDPLQAAKVQNDINEGKLAGIKGTPSFLINGKLIRGAQPFAAFKQLIEAELDNTVVLEDSDDAVCNSDADCKEARSFPAYCSRSKTNETCITTSTPTCKLPGTKNSECVNIITEECTPCAEGLTCNEGKCE